MTKAPSYSEVIRRISNGEVESLILIPELNEVYVTFNNGSVSKIPVLNNDQNILKVAKESGTPLSVKNISGEQALASFGANLVIIFLILFGLLIFIQRQ